MSSWHHVAAGVVRSIATTACTSHGRKKNGWTRQADVLDGLTGKGTKEEVKTVKMEKKKKKVWEWMVME